MMNRAARQAAEYKRDVDATAPEAPPTQWTCPICSARQPAGVAFCVHVLAVDEESDLHLPAPTFRLMDEQH